MYDKMTPEELAAYKPYFEAIVVGHTLKEANKNSNILGTRYRVASKDGESYMLNQDYKPERANLTIERDIVTKVTWG